MIVKHDIIVKFKPGVDYMTLLPDIRAIFKRTEEIQGVHGVELILGINQALNKNRFDLNIEMTMERESLPDYDASAAHKEWKTKYGPMIESKCIFDYE